MKKRFNAATEKLAIRVVASASTFTGDFEIIHFRIHFNEIMHMTTSDLQLQNQISEIIPECVLVKHVEMNEFKAIFYLGDLSNRTKIVSAINLYETSKKNTRSLVVY